MGFTELSQGITLLRGLRASQGRLDAPWIVLPGAGRSRLRVRSLSNACPSPESPYPAWRAQALRRIINAGSYAVRPPSSSEGSSSSRATTPPAFRRLKHRSAPPADSRDAGRARDDGRGWTLAPDPPFARRGLTPCARRSVRRHRSAPQPGEQATTRSVPKLVHASQQ